MILTLHRQIKFLLKGREKFRLKVNIKDISITLLPRWVKTFVFNVGNQHEFSWINMRYTSILYRLQ